MHKFTYLLQVQLWTQWISEIWKLTLHTDIWQQNAWSFYIFLQGMSWRSDSDVLLSGAYVRQITSIITTIMMIIRLIVGLGRIVRLRFSPRLQINVWNLSTRHSLIVTLTVDSRHDFFHVHRSILIPVIDDIGSISSYSLLSKSLAGNSASKVTNYVQGEIVN